jgi:hypothetical protein
VTKGSRDSVLTRFYKGRRIRNRKLSMSLTSVRPILPTTSHVITVASPVKKEGSLLVEEMKMKRKMILPEILPICHSR